MEIKIISDSFNKEVFNQIAPHPLQSWQWGKARDEMGIKVLRIGEFVKDKLQNVYQLTFHKIPFTNYKISYLPRSNFPSGEVLTFLNDYGKKNKIIFIKIEPFVEKSKFQISSRVTRDKFQISKHPLFPTWTQILDLTKSEDELLKNMHYKTRYNIRLAQKKGIIVKEMSNDEGFKIFSKLFFETCRRQKYFGHTPKYHQIIWKNLRGEIAHILVAFYKQTPLAAYELFYWNKIMYYPYGGSSLEHRNLMATNLLMWEVIRLGKRLGAEKFDMWGSLPPNYQSNNPWFGFTRFKEGYGGKFVEMVGSFDLVVNDNLYNLYNLTEKLRNFYLNIKKFLV